MQKQTANLVRVIVIFPHFSPFNVITHKHDIYIYKEMSRACGAYGGGERCAQGSGGET
jgi:hypothetical protein